MMRRLLAVSVAVVGGLPAVLAAQVETTHPGLITGAEYRTVSFGAGLGTKTVSELAVPLGFSLPVSRRVSFDIGSYFVRAQRTDESGAVATVTGLTDVVIRSAFQLKPDVAVFTLSANLPTGQHSLDGNQDLVARAIATDLVPFPVANLGTGFNITSGLALAAPVGSWALGLAGSYRFNSSYQPFSDTTTTLKPGGEVRLRVGADRLIGQGRMSLGVTYSTFSDDEFGGTPRSPGTRIIPQASWSLPLGNNSLALYAWDVYRNLDESTAGTAKENTVAIGAIFGFRMGRNTLRPLFEYRQAWRGPGGLQPNGSLFGVGARYALQTGGRVSITPGFRFDFGSIPNGTSPSASVTGLSASLMIRGSL